MSSLRKVYIALFYPRPLKGSLGIPRFAEVPFREFRGENDFSEGIQ